MTSFIPLSFNAKTLFCCWTPVFSYNYYDLSTWSTEHRYNSFIKVVDKSDHAKVFSKDLSFEGNKYRMFQSPDVQHKRDIQVLDTYKQLKKAAKSINPDVTKEEIYEQLLKPFRYEKLKHWDCGQHKSRISYIWRYNECNKEFTKTWNLLDHVRMHEGIKPFVCQQWRETFTQKGNLKKHNLVHHSLQKLHERKKFSCNFWSKKYTERYNLMVCFI